MAAITWPRGDTYVEDWKITRPAVQDVIVEGTPTGGTFVLDVVFPTGVETTDNVAFNANAAAVLAALENLQSVDAGDVSVSGGPGPGTKWTATWATSYAPAMTARGTFSGGIQPKVYVRKTAFNLTGATLRWTLKAAATQSDGQAAISHRWTDGGTISPAGAIVVATPSNGKVVHTITAAEMAALAPGTVYSWDAQLTDANGITTTLDSGTLQVTADITITAP